MSTELTKTPHLTPQTAAQLPTPLPAGVDLPYDDGEPLESNLHRIAMNVLIDGLHAAFAGRRDYFVGGNMFIHYNPQRSMSQDFRGPDFFVVLNVDGSKERKHWVLWEEEWRYPDVIVELLSPSTRRTDLRDKKRLYAETFQTREYFIYDPFDADSLQGWRLAEDGSYQDLAKDERGWLWCQELGLWLGSWQGELVRETAPWLRFYQADGSLVLLAVEREQQERREKEQERQRAEQEQQRAEQERQRAEQERQRAEQERQRAEQERREKEQERQARLDAVSRFLALGLSVAEVATALNLPLAVVEQIQDRQTP